MAGLAGSPACPVSMSVLAGTDPAQLSLGDRVELIRAWERASWVAAPALAAVDSLQAPTVGRTRRRRCCACRTGP